MELPIVSVRPACGRDIKAIEALARRATRDLLGPFLDGPQQSASMEFTPLDPWLIEDRTYFVVEIDGSIRASGGWSFREELVHSKTSDARSPTRGRSAVARLRAMYTDPTVARRGWSRALVALIEAAARTAGCRRMELLATPVGRLLYERCGYRVDCETELVAENGVSFRVARMSKVIRNAERDGTGALLKLK